MLDFLMSLFKRKQLKPITAHSDGGWSLENEKRWIKDAKVRTCPFAKRKCQINCMAFRSYEYPCCVLAQDSRQVRGYALSVAIRETPQI